MTLSIIIAVKTWQKNLEECVAKCQQLDFPEYEIIILPDIPFNSQLLSIGKAKIKIIPTGSVDPAKKRDIGLTHAKGEIIAFLDDDAYPRADWLKNALFNFKDEDVAAVGGPAITPSDDSFMQKASGAVYENILVSGNFSYRYIPGKRQFIEDYPSCNFIIRKSVLDELGGFNTKFWPGEDTKLCLNITHKLKKKIVYDPKVLVYHHRRPLFKAHLNQIKNYALHRGYFVKKYPQTSFKLSYFLPSSLLIFTITGLFLSFLCNFFALFYFVSIVSYLVLVIIFSLKNGFAMLPVVFLGIIATHFVYGLYFLMGLAKSKLKEEKI